MRISLALGFVLASCPLAAFADTTCTLDGTPWPVRLATPFVATNPATGRRLVLNIWDTGPKELPYLQVTVSWAKLDGKPRAKISIENAQADSPLEASFTRVAATPPQPPDFVQAGLHFLERGTLTLVAIDKAAKTLSLDIDASLREGEARHAKAATAKVHCSIKNAPLEIK